MDSIPHIIHQTHKSFEYIKSNKELSDAVQTWINTGYDYRFYDDNQTNDLMKTLEDEFPGIYDLYNNLPLPVMKADIFRYCVVYKVGGIYADADCVLVDGKIGRLVNYNGFVCPYDDGWPGLFGQYVFSAPPKSPVLYSIITVILRKLSGLNFAEVVKKNIQFVHYLTGPTIFTEGIREYILGRGETQQNMNYIKENVLTNKSLLLKHDIVLLQEYLGEVTSHLVFGRHEGGWKDQAESLYYNTAISSIILQNAYSLEQS